MATSGNRPSPRTTRADGRSFVNLTVEQPDGTKRRVYLDVRTREVAVLVCCEQLARAEVVEPTVIALAQAGQTLVQPRRGAERSGQRPETRTLTQRWGCVRRGGVA